jgi:cyclopropane-fatty-acyl-phospholipid synthase
MGSAIQWAEKGALPDALVRAGIRKLLRQRLSEQPPSEEASQDSIRKFLDQMAAAPIALKTDLSRKQHYEVAPEFFQHCLGPHLKYSCCWYDERHVSLGQAEEAMLELTCERAQLADGQNILELGCGWGSLSLRMAKKYPHSKITAVSHSKDQRLFIESQREKRGLHNLHVITCDMNDFAAEASSFDRVVSVEMFEHMRNYSALLKRVASWMKPEALMFIHIFCHRRFAYLFEEEGEDNWMGKYFFSGGMMPSRDLLFYINQDLQVADHWVVNGMHYSRTCEDWLKNLDSRRTEVQKVFERDMSAEQAQVWIQRWRIFFMSCSELFRFHQGNEWFVGHYLLKKGAA